LLWCGNTSSCDTGVTWFIGVTNLFVDIYFWIIFLLLLIFVVHWQYYCTTVLLY
jgi:hypothetical protein